MRFGKGEKSGPIFPALSVLLFGSAVTDYIMKKNITKIVFSFKDGTIPHQYFPGYIVIVTKEQSHILVHSYGDVLTDVTIDIPEQIIKDLANYIKIFKIREKKPKRHSKICIGANSKSLTVYSDGKIILNGTFYQYRGYQEGTLSGDIESFARKIEGLIHNFSNLLK